MVAKYADNLQDLAKEKVLKSFSKLLKSREMVHRVRILYNGNATVCTKKIPKDKTKCGAFACLDSQVLYIEDFLKLANKKGGEQESKLIVHMYADCPGSAGLYHRLANLTTSGQI
jgi:hypothetical protein